MKRHQEPHPSHRLSDWDEIRALILHFILQIGFALAMIGVLALADRAAQAGEISRHEAVCHGRLLFTEGHGGPARPRPSIPRWRSTSAA